MNKMNKTLIASILTSGCLAFGIFSSNLFANQVSGEFLLSKEEMQDIASPTKLSHRIFYAEPSKGADAAWFDAVKKGDLATVKSMVEAGQNIEAKDEASLGQTALGWAAFIGYEDMVKYLVAQNADLFATDRADVKNSLKSAVLGKNVNVVKYLYELLKDEVDLNEQEADGETMLIVAASNDRLDIVKFLLENGADISVISEPKQQNALTFACKGGYQEVADYLISKGAVNFKTGKPSCDAN
ncbi:ankyrin repeat domain-containing protein [Thorsellia anophelis]|uniref:Ankyrin repeat n=1 Tax=Thorsellia anophelis DSM 18579 TaxID=1123402 RepID=A0A1H9ZYK9_9GAMM|nr:ankyrin repeat domain-containing protein [Thorsellia anophelis]SES85981.1 Ankyrin repeat [Thorsellia anophelis DSM 18579]